MSAQRRVRILAHREQAARLSSARSRSRSAELEREDAGGGQPAAAPPLAAPHLPSGKSAHSPKRPRTLAPMQHPGLRMQRQAQGAEETREHSELSDVLHSFASAGACRHGRSVDHQLSRLKDQLCTQGDPDQVPAARLPLCGARVVLTGLSNGSNYNGREAVVLGADGRDRVLVQVCGASELCQLSVRVDNMAVVEEPAHGDTSYEAGRDFSEIHKLATLHAQSNAKREVERLAAEADERRRAMENAVRADSLINTSNFSVQLPTRQRCRHGTKCGKPDCMDLHPWEADWVEGGAASGCDSKSKFKAAKGIYRHLAPVTRARGRVPQRHQAAQGGSPNAKQNAADIAVEIDRLLAQAGVPVAARQAAHHNVIPLLCSHGPAQPREPRAKTRLLHRGLRTSQPGCTLVGNYAPAHPGRTKVPGTLHGAVQPKSLQELRLMQQSLQMSLDGAEEHEQAVVGLHAQHDDGDQSPHSEAQCTMAASHAIFVDEDELKSPSTVPSWRDEEDAISRKKRITQLVDIKKAEWRKQKLLRENALLQEALMACGAALMHPLSADVSDNAGDVSYQNREEETNHRQRIRPHVMIEDDE